MYEQIDKSKYKVRKSAFSSVYQKNGQVTQRAGLEDNRNKSSPFTVSRSQKNISSQEVIQCYQIKQVSYDSSEAALAVRTREAEGNWACQVNYGSLIDGLGPNLVMQSGAYHAEQLLIGARVHALGKSNSHDPAVLASIYKTLGREVSVLYTERMPCPVCVPILTSALQPQDIVYYSIPYGNNELLEHEIWEYRHKEDFSALREMEEEDERKQTQQKVNEELSRGEFL